MELKRATYAATPPPRTLSRPAMTGFILGIVGWAVFCGGGLLLPSPENMERGPFSNWMPSAWAALAALVIGGSLSLVSVARILQSKGRQSGLAPAGLGMALALIGLIFIALSTTHL